MVSVTRRYEWSMGHRLMRHAGRCRWPHGHTYAAEVTVEGPVDDTGDPSHGMVVDFAELDDAVRVVVDPWDHGFMVEDADPFRLSLRDFEARTHSARVVEVPWTPTAENIALHLLRALELSVPGGLRVTRVRVEEGPRSWAEVTS